MEELLLSRHFVDPSSLRASLILMQTSSILTQLFVSFSHTCFGLRQKDSSFLHDSVVLYLMHCSLGDSLQETTLGHRFSSQRSLLLSWTSNLQSGDKLELKEMFLIILAYSTSAIFASSFWLIFFTSSNHLEVLSTN